MRLNLGVGDPEFHPPSEWLTVDSREGTRPDVYADLVHLPFADGSAEQVYLGHVLEHVWRRDIPKVLAEVRRVLDGELLVVGPDVDRGLDMANEGRITWDRYASLLTTPNADDNPALHKWDCRPSTVMADLVAAGFDDVREVPIPQRDSGWWVFDPVSEDQMAVMARSGVA